MEFLNKISNFVKTKQNKIEKVLLFVSALILLAVNLVFNIYADTKLNITVGYLLYGLLTGVISGGLMLLALNKNAYDVTDSGIAILVGGNILSILSIFLFPAYKKSEQYSELITEVKTSVSPVLTIFMVLSIIAAVISILPLISQIIRKFKEIESNEAKIQFYKNSAFFGALYLLGITTFIAFCNANLEVFGLLGFVKYSWIVLISVPFILVTLVYSILSARKNWKLKINKVYVIVDSVFIVIACVVGALRPMASNISYDFSKVEELETKLNIEIANDSISTYNSSNSHYKIMLNEDEVNSILKQVEFKNSYLKEIENKLPTSIKNDNSIYDGYALYNPTTNEYNKYPNKTGVYYCTFFAIQKYTGELFVIDNMKIIYIKK